MMKRTKTFVLAGMASAGTAAIDDCSNQIIYQLFH